MEIKEEDDYWFVDIYPNRGTAYSKEVKNNIVDIGYDEGSKEYFIKGVHYNKNGYNIDEVMDKAKEIYMQAKKFSYGSDEDSGSENKGKECIICKGLNRIKKINEINYSNQTSKVSEKSISDNYAFSPSMLKLIIDLPSRLFLTPMGRKLGNAFLLLVSNLLKDQVHKSEKKTIEMFMDQLIKDITIDEKELPYLYNNLASIAKGIQKNDLSLISSAIIKNPETTKKYLDSLLPDSKDESKSKKKQRKFI